jgi:hypothetical protein
MLTPFALAGLRLALLPRALGFRARAARKGAHARSGIVKLGIIGAYRIGGMPENPSPERDTKCSSAFREIRRSSHVGGLGRPRS